MLKILNNQYLDLRFTVSSKLKCSLPGFLGSALRGVMGEQLLKKYCKNATRHCKTCQHIYECDFVKIFYRLDLTHKSKFELPVQYVIYCTPCKRDFQMGDCFSFNITLFGQAIGYENHIINAIEEGCLLGLSVNRYPFSLVNVKKEEKKVISENQAEITQAVLDFDTPVRIKTHEKGINWTLNFEVLFLNIVRRLSELDIAVLPADEQDLLMRQARSITTSYYGLTPYYMERYSNRTKSKKSMSGLMGTIAFDGDLTVFSPYLKAGSVIHIGKGCSMGLGHYGSRGMLLPGIIP